MKVDSTGANRHGDTAPGGCFFAAPEKIRSARWGELMRSRVTGRARRSRRRLSKQEACGQHGGEFPPLPYRASRVRGHFIMAPVRPPHDWNLWVFSMKTKPLLVDTKPCAADEQLINDRWRSGSHDPASLVHEQNGGKMKQGGTFGRDSSTLIYNPLLIKSCIFHWLIPTPIWRY